MIHISENKLIKLVQAWYSDTEGRDSFRTWWKDHGKEVYTSPMNGHEVDRVVKGDQGSYRHMYEENTSEPKKREVEKERPSVEVMSVVEHIREMMGDKISSYRAPVDEGIVRAIRAFSVTDRYHFQELLPEFSIKITDKELLITRTQSTKESKEENNKKPHLDPFTKTIVEPLLVLLGGERELRMGGIIYDSILSSLNRDCLDDLRLCFDKRGVYVEFREDYLYMCKHTTLVYDWLKTKCGAAPYMQFQADSMKEDCRIVVNLLRLTDDEERWINERLMKMKYQMRVCEKEGIVEFYLIK